MSWGLDRSGRVLLPIVGLLVGNVWAQPASNTTTRISNSLTPVGGKTVFDAAGNMYSFASTRATAGAAQSQPGGGTCPTTYRPYSGPCPDAAVSKVDTAGNLVFGTWLGGPTGDRATALSVDAAGNVFVVGTTDGSFPTTAIAAIAGSTTSKTFAAKLSADGSQFLYSTYLPDTVASAAAVSVDGAGNAYIAGMSNTGHGLVLKVSADGSAFPYYTVLAGSNVDSAVAILAEAGGSVIVVGETTSADFPISAGAVQSQISGGQDVFVTKLDASGHVAYSTYLGGSGTDTPTALRTDSAGNIYVAGATTSLDFPTTASTFQPTPVVPLWNGTSPGGFIAKLSSNGSSLIWSSYVMSFDYQDPHNSFQQGVAELAVTASGEVYISGLTGPGFPVTASAPQICFDDLDSPPGTFSNANAFVAHLDPNGALLNATYAGKYVTGAMGLSVAGDGTVLLVWVDQGNLKSELRFGGTGWAAPACLSTNVLNAATMTGHAAGVAAGELISLTGFGIGPEVGEGYRADSEGLVPRQVAGVQVLFDGQAAPVLYAQSRQVNALVPLELKWGPNTVTTITITYNGMTIGSATVPVTYGVPGIFRRQLGSASLAAALNQDGTPNSPSNPAVRGTVVSVWGTGFGLTDPPCVTGGTNPMRAVNLAAGLSAMIADSPTAISIAAAPAQYAGAAPGMLCGVTQINFLVPTYVPPGPYEFFPWSQIQVDGPLGSVQVPFGATIFVK